MILLFLACITEPDFLKADLCPESHHDFHCHQDDGIHEYNIMEAWSRGDQWILRLSALPLAERQRGRPGTNPWVVMHSLRGQCHEPWYDSCVQEITGGL